MLKMMAMELQTRRKARRSLLDFILYINPDYIVSDFSITLCAELDVFINQMRNGERPILVIGAPPQHGKSDIVSRYLPAFVFGLFPDMRIGGLSYAMGLATNMNRDVQRIIMSDRYAKLFPETRLSVKRIVTVEAEAKRNSEEFEIVGKKGSYIGAGVGGALTGKSLDLGIIDDPIKNAKEALSPTVKKGVWDWYTSTFLTRLSKNSAQIIMATRWAVDDLSGRVIEHYERAKVLVFPAINSDGTALVPDLHPLDKLLEYKSTLGDYFWSAMYMQSPKTLGGTIFKDQFVQYYLPKDLPKRFDEVIHSWDMTFKDTEGTDFVVGQVWGRLGANVYLLHQVRDRLSFSATAAAVKKMAKDFPLGRVKLIEDKANGPAIINHLKDVVTGLAPVEPLGSKTARAHAVTPEWEAGNVWLPHKDIAPWIVDFVANLTSFPSCAYDDEIDAMTQALNKLFGSGKTVFIF